MANHAYNAQVVRLQKSIGSRMDLIIPTAVAQEAVAAVHGMKNWNTLVAQGPGGDDLLSSIESRSKAFGPSPVLRTSLTLHFATKPDDVKHETNFCGFSVVSDPAFRHTRLTVELANLLIAGMTTQNADDDTFSFPLVERSDDRNEASYRGALSVLLGTTIKAGNGATFVSLPLVEKYRVDSKEKVCDLEFSEILHFALCY